MKKLKYEDRTDTPTLKLPMIWQLIQPDKIGNLEKCLRNLRMTITPIGKDDFSIDMQ